MKNSNTKVEILNFVSNILSQSNGTDIKKKNDVDLDITLASGISSCIQAKIHETSKNNSNLHVISWITHNKLTEKEKKKKSWNIVIVDLILIRRLWSSKLYNSQMNTKAMIVRTLKNIILTCVVFATLSTCLSAAHFLRYLYEKRKRVFKVDWWNR